MILWKLFKIILWVFRVALLQQIVCRLVPSYILTVAWVKLADFVVLLQDLTL